jgi:GAF domain-containing protein
MSNLPLLFISAGVPALLAIGWYGKQEITRRRRAEILLQQQTDRERLVNQIAQHIRQSLDLDRVLATTVEAVQQLLQADRVLIYRIGDDGTGCAIHETVLAPYPAVLGQTFPAEVFPSEYHQAYTLGKTRTIANVAQEDVEPCLVDFVKQFGVQAKLVVPIIQDNRQANITANPTESSPTSYLWGLLIAHQCSHPRIWAIGRWN